MDPFACLTRMINALAEADFAEAADAAEELAKWLRGGGFGPTIDQQEDAGFYCSVGNLTACAIAWRAAHDAREHASAPPCEHCDRADLSVVPRRVGLDDEVTLLCDACFAPCCC